MIYRGIGGGGAEKNLLALKWAQLEPKNAKMRTSVHFDIQNTLIFANIAHYDLTVSMLIR